MLWGRSPRLFLLLCGHDVVAEEVLAEAFQRCAIRAP